MGCGGDGGDEQACIDAYEALLSRNAELNVDAPRNAELTERAENAGRGTWPEMSDAYVREAAEFEAMSRDEQLETARSQAESAEWWADVTAEDAEAAAGFADAASARWHADFAEMTADWAAGATSC